MHATNPLIGMNSNKTGVVMGAGSFWQCCSFFLMIFLVFFSFVYLFLGFFTNPKEGVDKVFDVMKVVA
jgi:hypothetical protein